jgi:steroid delta-isomerase-like uncharacterized protein
VTDPESVVRRFYSALNERDFGAAAAVIAERCEWTSMASRARERGPAPVLKGLLDWVEAFPDIKFEILDLVADGERVAVEWRTVGTHLGEFRGHAATRRRLDRRGCTLAEVKDGKLVRVRDYYDRQTLAEQLRL